MNIKVVVVLFVLAGSSFLGWRYMESRRMEEFCARAEECMQPWVFEKELGSPEACLDNQAGKDAGERFAKCGPELGCEEWIICGFSIEDLRKIKREKPKTNFEEVLPVLSD